MAKANKTVETLIDPAGYLNAIESDHRRADAEHLLEMMSRLSGQAARMWGDSMVGFGRYHYQYVSGREGEFFRTGFAVRKQALVVYIMGGFESHAALLARLGPYRTGRSCLYIKSLDQIDRSVLEQLIADSLEIMRARYPEASPPLP